MEAPLASPPPSDPEAGAAPAPDPAEAPPTDQTDASGSTAAQPASADHHGLITFLGVLALILLLAGAVAASSLSPGGGSDADRQGSGQGNAFGQQKKAEKQQQREERQAEKREQQRQHKERQRALQEQRRQSGATEPEVAEAISEQTGTVATQAGADGTATYVLQTAGGTLILDIGPPRYWGNANPLAPLVGTSVTMTGVQESGSDHFAVFTIGDQVIRGPGRPPWAGGGKANSQAGPMNLPSPGISPTPSSSPAP